MSINMAYLARRRALQVQRLLTTNSKIFSETCLKCLSTSQPLHTQSTIINNRKNHLTHHVIKIPSKQFHLSTYLKCEAEEKSPLQERYGKECVVVPLSSDKVKDVRYIQKQLVLLSFEHDIGFKINSKGKDPYIKLFTKTTDQAENVGHLVSQMLEELKGMNMKNSNKLYNRRVQIPYAPKQISSKVVRKALIVKDLNDLEEQTGCTITSGKAWSHPCIMVYSSDVEKLKEAEKLVEKLLKETLQRLRSCDVTQLPFPDNLPANFEHANIIGGSEAMRDIFKEYEKKMFVHVALSSEVPKRRCFEIFADTREIAEKVKEQITKIVDERAKSIQNNHNEVLHIPANKELWNYLKRSLFNVIRDKYPSISFHHNLDELREVRADASIPTQYFISGDNPEQVKRVVEILKMVIDNVNNRQTVQEIQTNATNTYNNCDEVSRTSLHSANAPTAHPAPTPSSSSNNSSMTGPQPREIENRTIGATITKTVRSIQYTDHSTTGGDEDIFEGVTYKRNARYYISGIGHRSTRLGMVNFLKRKGITVSHFVLFKQKHPGSCCNAKLDVALSDAQTVEAPGFWPRGISCRPWLSEREWDNKITRKETQNSDDVLDENWESEQNSPALEIN